MTSGRLAVPLVLACLAALAGPVLFAAIPPISDYPNHLARLWLLTRPIPEPLSHMYAVRWDTLTNIGIDMLAMLLSRVVEYDVAGRIVVAVAVVLPPLAGTMLFRVLHGRWHWWQLSFSLLAWGMATLDGFLNFEIGLGCAMLAACLEPAFLQRPAPIGLLARAVIAAMLLLVHAFAVLFYAALLCAFVVGPRRDGRAIGRFLVDSGLGVLGRAVPIALAVLAMAAVAPHLPGDETGQGIAGIIANFQNGFAALAADPAAKLKRSVVGLRSYSNAIDILCFVILLLPPLAALATGRLRVHLGMALVAGGLAVCFLVFPFHIAVISWIDTRFVHMAPYAALAALRPDLPRRLTVLLAAFLLGASLVRTTSVGIAWSIRQADARSVHRALGAVPPGAAILAVEHKLTNFRSAPYGRYTMAGEPTWRHLPALAIPWRRAFIPNLFASRGVQPVELLPPWSRLGAPDGGWLLSVDALSHPDKHAALIRSTVYWRSWQADFDYVLVMNADVPDDYGPFTPPPSITLVADEGFAQLFAITRPPR